MFGAPDLEDPKDLDLELLAMGVDEADEDDEERGWPYSGDPNVIFLINERISPRGVSWADKAIWGGVAVSILFHLLVFSQLLNESPLSRFVASMNALSASRRPPVDTTPFYELVELPKQKQEPPARQKPPLSDLDRRAHGGVGAPAPRPGSQGSSPDLRMQPPVADTKTRTADAGSGKDAAKETADDHATSVGQETTTRDRTTSADAMLLPAPGGGAAKGLNLRGISGYGPGSIGGNVPQRKGGSVDLGPLSFDTKWYDWGPYAAEMLRRIKYHWEIPAIAQLGVGGVVRIHFVIERSGRVSDVVIEVQSGHPPMDFAARDAIWNASPLPPLPPDLTDVDREGVTITFYYNTPVPDGEYTG